MEHAADIHLAVVADSIHEEVTWAMNRADRLPDAIPAIPEMIGACGRGDLRTGVTAGTLGTLSHVDDGPGQQRLVSTANLFSELLVRPFKDDLDVPLGLWREPVIRHQYLLTAGAGSSALGRPSPEIAYEVGKLPLVFEHDTLATIEGGKALRRQPA